MARGRFRHAISAFTAAVVVVAAVGAVGFAVPTFGFAAGPISQAKAQAGRIAGQIAALDGRMAVVAGRYDATAQRLSLVDARITANRRRLVVARYDLAVAHRTLAGRVVAMYKAPASGFLDVALSAKSFDDLVSRVNLWNGIFRQGAAAVTTVERYKGEVQRQAVRLQGDHRQAQTLLAQVAAQRTEIAAEVHQGQTLLAAAQAKVTTLVKQDKARKAAAAAAARAAAAAARRAAAAGYHPVSGTAGAYSPTSWAQALLGYLGLPRTSQNLTAITAWELAEGGNWFNSARYNPLDTTMPEPGATDMNSVGVKAYTSWAEGFTATVATLRNGLYGPILAALQKGDGALAVAEAVAASPWGTGGFGV
jgi:peptidoglycan hydrolase CwlO-like protein